MKKAILALFVAGLTISNGQAQVVNGIKNKISKKVKQDKKGKQDKKDKGGKTKDLDVEFTEDEFEISGLYYTWQPEGAEFFKKIPQVVLQYDHAKRTLEFHVSKKESLSSYRVNDVVRTYKMDVRCGEFGFDDYRRIGPDLWTNEIGMFMNAGFNRDHKTCETSNFRINDKTFIMSKDKEFIDNMTLEKFKELFLKKREEACICFRDWRSGVEPIPQRKMRDAEVEAEALKLIKATAQKQHWEEEILGVYIASEKWTKANLWVSSNGEYNSAERMNMVVLMKKDNTCSYQRFVIANDNWKIDENGSHQSDGITMAGTIPENKYVKCSKVEELLK